MTAAEGGATGRITGRMGRSAAAPLGDRHAPLRDLVAQEIRRAILAGRFKPGERLVEDRLARDFGVSRNPVREALRALASEGLIEVTARRGAAVAALDPGAAQEMVEVRAALEGFNARLAARRRDPRILGRLQDILKRGSDAARNGQIERLGGLNGRFHDTLADAGSNQILADLMRSLRERTSRVFGPISGDRAERTWTEHAEILKAVIAGDEDLACLLATRHVLNAGADYLAEQGPAEQTRVE
jgi:DNA-binding GntR family transcriptional regulator